MIKDWITQKIVTMGKNQKGLYTFDDNYIFEVGKTTRFSTRF